MYYPVAALVTLFANIIQNPHDPRGRSDLALINKIVDYMSTVVRVELNVDCRMAGEDVQRMILICAEFRRITERVLEKAEKEGNTRRKRKFNGDLAASSKSNTVNNSSNMNSSKPSSLNTIYTPPEPSTPLKIQEPVNHANTADNSAATHQVCRV